MRFERSSPHNTSRTCPRCGYVVKRRVSRAFKCIKCGFKLDRQKLASLTSTSSTPVCGVFPAAVSRSWMKGSYGLGLP
ncbi:MAG: zinc ribbon domain-containing protein [Fervidicoccaceae archaeon]